ncbi:MAG: Rrf2 family transcriptional regulator [Lachnospiraceae bacterium]|nr:Rrf2 family transcriptional regulator [Lachnospiraceae bacterium]MBR3516107.1 Rrf2 family transcriptional regulator [Lachnospiraceae bacterium]MBR3735371.1 Rrf2 family transcriptional regulator [Lachnospiraceae bacterium]MBR6155579.1 Rrf2 family transcriptional regulator [Lachnospiraceae bacterium]
MRVSTRVEYGLIALADIVIHCENGQSVSAPDIAKRQNISHKYLEHILLPLRQAGFITAQKGLRGGYVLSCKPDQVKLTDVLNALDNTLLAEMEKDESEGNLRSVINGFFWQEINSNLKDYTDRMSLSDFVSQCRNGVSEGWDLYVI